MRLIDLLKLMPANQMIEIRTGDGIDCVYEGIVMDYNNKMSEMLVAGVSSEDNKIVVLLLGYYM